MDSKGFLLVLVAAAIMLLAIVLVRYLVVWLRLRRMRFCVGEVEPVDRAGMPSDIAAILDPVAARLAVLGFEYEETRLVRSMVRKSDPTPAWADIYVHLATGSRASAQVSDAPEPGLAATISFVTYFVDQILETANRRAHLLFPMPANYRIEDAGAASLADHWAFHCRRLAVQSAAVVSDGAELRRRYSEMRAGLFDHWLESGFMCRSGDDWHLTATGAWRYLRRVMAGTRRLASLPPYAELEELRLRVLADSHAWRGQEASLRDNGMSRRGKVLWFAVSALAGAAAFGFVISWQVVPIILGVLLFHEFGHALAMRAFGYSGLSVLVLPFLGAVAIGRKDDADPWQKLLVLLAGPLPGLILAVVCLRLAPVDPDYRELLTAVGAMALGINLFNLLPLTPLDGGQIIDTFLFSQRPRLRFGFFAASTLALVALAIALKSTALVAAGVILALAIPGSWRRLRFLAGMDPKGARADPVESLFERLQDGPGPRWPSFTQRIQTVRSLLPALRGRPPTALEGLLGLTAYLATLALPAVLLWDTGLPQQAFAELSGLVATSHRSPPPPDWQGQLQKATTSEQRWRVLWQAGQWFEEMEDDEQARHRYQESLAEALALPAGAETELHLLDTRIALARFSEADAARAYAALLPALRALPDAERWRLADVLEALNGLESDVNSDERIARLREAVWARETADSEDAFRLLQDRIELARLVDAKGDAVGAEALLRSNLAAPDGESGRLVSRRLEPMAWFLIAHGRAVEAEALLSDPARNPRNGGNLRQTLAWSQLIQGKTDSARELLASELEVLNKQRWSAWQRLTLMLDLIYASADAPQQQARWLTEATQLAAAEANELRGMRNVLARETKWLAWENPRSQARMEALQRLPASAGQ